MRTRQRVIQGALIEMVRIAALYIIIFQMDARCF